MFFIKKSFDKTSENSLEVFSNWCFVLLQKASSLDEVFMSNSEAQGSELRLRYKGTSKDSGSTSSSCSSSSGFLKSIPNLSEVNLHQESSLVHYINKPWLDDHQYSQLSINIASGSIQIKIEIIKDSILE